MTLSARIGITLLLFCGGASSFAQVQTDSTLNDDKVHVDLMPYLIAPGMSGDVKVKGVYQSINPSAADILSHLQFGFMGRARVSYNRAFVGSDVLYMGLGGANDAVNAGFDQWAAELLGGYRINELFSVLGGVRYNDLSADFKFKGPVETHTRGSEVWWDPFIGAVDTLPLGKKFSASARLDLGGFSAGSKIAVNAEPSLQYSINKRFSAGLGWKFYYLDYVNNEKAFEYDVLTQGPMMSLSMRW
jgi:hypothetical protein